MSSVTGPELASQHRIVQAHAPSTRCGISDQQSMTACWPCVVRHGQGYSVCFARQSQQQRWGTWQGRCNAVPCR